MAVIASTYREWTSFRPEGFNPVKIGETERVRLLLGCFEPGQSIPVHHPPIDLSLAVLEGEGILTAGDREVPIGPGTVALIPAGEARGIRAGGRLVVFLVAAPPPTEADHAEITARP